MKKPDTARADAALVAADNDGALVLAVTGRIDSNNAGRIEAEILKHVGPGLDRLVIDLAGLDYISSAGLRVLLITAKKMRQLGGRFALARLRPQITEVMEVSGFTAIMPCLASLDEALARVARP
ncbi:MAG: STAS domain-containing protein [Ancalomicrobiaceae bacterium]|nr:STAS domain-containing protein [Ancalomicrobiaceae bacterium]